MVFGPVAVAYHLDGVKQLVVNADVLAKIFSGWITDWNDPAIVELNPDAKLPATRISPVYRSDSSGTTDNFQKYLAAAAPNSWTRGTGSEFQGGVGEGAQKSAGVIQAVQSASGSIGYVEKGFADQSGVPYAQINDGSGPVALTDDAARKAIDGATFAGLGNDLELNLKSIYRTTSRRCLPAGAGHLRNRLLQGLRPGHQCRGQVHVHGGRRQRSRRSVGRRLCSVAG